MLYAVGCDHVETILVFGMRLFAASFLCGIYRRRSIVLGMERQWPSDACVFFVFDGLMRFAEGDVFLDDEMSFVQIGDGTTTQRYTPVGVVGLSSGIVMVALGSVRFFYFDWCVSDVFLWERLLCV
jgi:hypothetical protein